MNNIFAAILAGGRSFRLGEDKALLRFNDIYILDYIYSQLTSLTTQIRIIGKPRAQVKIEPGLFVPDRITGLGPLGGLYTALHLTSQPVLVVPCDMPFLNSAQIESLIKDFDASYDAIIAVSSKGLEPLLGIYNPEILSKFGELNATLTSSPEVTNLSAVCNTSFSFEFLT